MSAAQSGIAAPYSRDVLRLLMKLAEKGAFLTVSRQGEGRVFSAGGGMKPHNVSAEALCALMRNELLAPGSEPGQWVISPAGRAALRRSLARNEPFREQHEERAVKPINPRGDGPIAIVNEAESPLAWLRRRTDRAGKPLIDDAQFRAGERLRADFTRAGMEPRLTANWDAVASSRRERRGSAARSSIRDSALEARQRLHAALDAVGPDFAGVLLDVCCFLKGLEDAERENGWPQRSGKIVLRLALNALARHYGLLNAPSRLGGSRRSVFHWGSSDYRPAITPDADGHDEAPLR